MKSKAVLFVLLVLVSAVCLWGCGGGGGSSNPAAPAQTLTNVTVQILSSTDKKPVEGATVVLTPSSSALADELLKKNVNASARMAVTKTVNSYSGITDSKGNATINNVPEGRYTMTANKAGMAQICQNMEITRASSNIPAVQLVPTGKITGVVTDKDNKAVGSAIVYIDGTSLNCVSTAEGYVLDGVPVGQKFTLKVIHSDGIDSVNNVMIDAKAPDFTLTKDITVTTDSSKAANIAVSITASSLDFKKYIVVGVGTNGNSVIALFNPDVSDNKKATYNAVVYQPDTYTFVAVCNDNSVAPFHAEARTNTVTVTASDISSKKAISGPDFIVSNSSELVDMIVKLPAKADADYEVMVYCEESGSERKAVITNGQDSCTFSGMSANSAYAVVAASENKLSIRRNVAAGNTVELAEPVEVVPSYTAEKGYITVNLNALKVADVKNDKNVIVSFFAGDHHNDEDRIELEQVAKDSNGSNISTNVIDAYTAKDLAFSTDNCGDGNYDVIALYSFAPNGSNQPCFKREFYKSGLTPLRETVKLSVFSARDEIIFFDVVTNLNNTSYFIVATTGSVYCFNSEGKIEGQYNFEQKLSVNNITAIMKESGDYKIFYQYVKETASAASPEASYELNIKSLILNSSTGKFADNSESVIVNSNIRGKTVKGLWANLNEDIVSSDVHYVLFKTRDSNTFSNATLSRMLEPYCGLINLYNTDNGNYSKIQNQCGFFYLSYDNDSHTIYYNFWNCSIDSDRGQQPDSDRKQLMYSGEATTNQENGGYYVFDFPENFSKKLFVCEDTAGICDKQITDNYLVYDNKLNAVYSPSSLQFDKTKTSNAMWYVERKNGYQTICQKINSSNGSESDVRKYNFNQISNSNSFLKGSLRSSEDKIFFIGMDDSDSNVQITVLNSGK